MNISFRRFFVVIAAVIIVVIISAIFTSADEKPNSNDDNSIAATKSNDEDNAYCCCSSDELETNASPLLEVLDDLVTKPFFRYFKVNVKKKCPYWVVHILCTQKANPCKFCRCDAQDIPLSLRTESDMGNALSAEWSNDDENKNKSDDDDDQTNNNNNNNDDKKSTDANKQQEEESLDRKTSEKHEETIGQFDLDAAKKDCDTEDGNNNNKKKQKIHQHQQKPAKCSKPEEPVDPNAEYVDLVRNPEGNTFYLGERASRVWRAVYEENCFFNASNANHEHQPECREQLVFYRLISGLHTSISTHIAAYYHVPLLPGDPRYKPVNSADDEMLQRIARMPVEERHMKRAFAKPNCTTFEDRLRSKPHHVANMHFLYRFVVRALTRSRAAFLMPARRSDDDDLDENDDGGAAMKMRDALKIGDESADAATEKLLQKLFQSHLLCSPTFNESKLLQEPNVVALLPEMKRMIRNMTTITDCISCEKCRLWGKLQLLGLATAFKIVMSPADSVPDLERKELMSLVNLARQLTDSVHNNRVMCRKAPQCHKHPDIQGDL